jgi:hypothetical protein
MLHAFVIRSDQARGHIRRLDLTAVRSAPGVHLVLTAQELQAWGARELPCLVQPPGQRSVPMPVLAQGEVQFVGQPLAVVIAESAWAAQDAAELADIDIAAQAAVVSVVGGLIGLLVSVGIVSLMNFILMQALPTGAVATLDWVIMGEGLAFSVVIGLVAGVYPALRAAKLDPIEALRHE